jgi:Skp family chaperone for outer membrane proteins
MATLGIGAYLGSQLWAQSAGQGTAGSREPLKTRIAVVNLRQVLKNYKKFKNTQEDIKNQITQAQNSLKPLEEQVTQLQKKLQQPDIATAQRDQIERELKKLIADGQEKKDEFTKKIRNLEGEMAVQIFKEIEDAVNLIATHNAIELVLTYNDFNKDEPTNYYNPSNVQQKLMTAPMLPMYIDSRMDITSMVTDMLNRKVAMNTTSGSSR